MVSVPFYRQEAERCRQLAAETKNIRLADQYRKSARDYEALADELDARPTPPPAPDSPMRQPIQQQQAKSEEPDSEG
jgi:hypothetical protein